ncbi:MAG TPA: TlpA disulfide reductase family protein [Chloroflexota bacterium]|nr:TlpA disulfide reductase family protein [Chloroflexota bacterium]
MKNQAVRSQPMTPAQRRAMDRTQKRHPRQQRPGILHQVSRGNIIAGFVTIAIVVGALVYALVRTSTAVSTPGLTSPESLNPAPSQPAVGTRAPNFALRDNSGQLHTLAAQQGHPVLVEFFAVWCPVCQGEAPIMAQITRNYVPKGVRVWSILASPYGPNYDLSGRTDLTLAKSADLAWFAHRFDVQHPQLIDPTFATVNRYGVGAYPGLYVVNPKGVITYAAEGHRDYSTLARALDHALRAAR